MDNLLRCCLTKLRILMSPIMGGTKLNDICPGKIILSENCNNQRNNLCLGNKSCRGNKPCWGDNSAEEDYLVGDFPVLEE